MERLSMLLVVLLVSGVDTCSYHPVSVPVKNVAATPADNITLYCDCKVSIGIYIVWFKNCFHENQPTLVLTLKEFTKDKLYINPQKFARFEFVKNDSSLSYDLLIMNITESDEGLYYCGTTEMDTKTTAAIIYKYSNISTRLLINSSGPHSNVKTPLQDCHVCWKLVFLVCPLLFVLSTFLSFLTIYLCCHKTKKRFQDDDGNHTVMSEIEEVQQEDVCYAALEIHHPSQKVKRKRTMHSSDYAVYTAVNKSKVSGESNFT